jgi:hypothetical protein
MTQQAVQKIEVLLENTFLELEEAEHKWGLPRNKKIMKAATKVFGKNNPISKAIATNRGVAATNAARDRTMYDKTFPTKSVYDSSSRKGTRVNAQKTYLHASDNKSPLKKGLEKTAAKYFKG